MAEDSKTDSIVAIKPCCNRVVFALVTLKRPIVVDAKMGRAIAELVVAGCKIEHWPVEAVHKAAWGCACDSKPPEPTGRPL